MGDEADGGGGEAVEGGVFVEVDDGVEGKAAEEVGVLVEPPVVAVGDD